MIIDTMIRLLYNTFFNLMKRKLSTVQPVDIYQATCYASQEVAITLCYIITEYLSNVSTQNI